MTKALFKHGVHNIAGFNRPFTQWKFTDVIHFKRSIIWAEKAACVMYTQKHNIADFINLYTTMWTQPSVYGANVTLIWWIKLNAWQMKGLLL